MSEAAEIAAITDQMKKALGGGNSGLNATLKFDFDGKGHIYIDGKAIPNIVSNDDNPADCTIIVALDTFKKMVARELDGTTAFMQGKMKVIGDVSVAMKLGPILAKSAQRDEVLDRTPRREYVPPTDSTADSTQAPDNQREIPPAETTKPPDNFNTYFWTLVVIALVLWAWLSRNPGAHDDRPGGGGCDRYQDGC